MNDQPDPERTRDSSSEPASISPLPPGVPRRIHHYEIRRVIASGGMGTVFEALQDNPKRPVAIKIMKHGMVSSASLKRFEIESQLLAGLRHPGIAQVYEAGTYDDGSGSVPFFAMEYISGAKTLTEYARDKGMGFRERLELFAQVCDAVHHGHQRGVIHRDLKPSNVLVDSSGRPRIIDFGVARSLDSERVQQSIRTEYGELVGSLPYMSPEQFDADPNDLDIRSDVYSLGVLLYELLSGQLPHSFEGATVFRAAQIAKEATPPRLGSVRPDLEGDVEAIVWKALEKDRDGRYQSAHGLAQDIRRYLAGEAITAQPPSVRYQLRVFARKNRALVAAVAGVFVVLLAGIAVSATLFFQAADERDRAALEAARAKSSSEFLTSMLAEGLPQEFGEETTVREFIDNAASKLGNAFPHDPDLEAEVRMTLGDSYICIEDFPSAIDQFKTAYELRRASLGEIDSLTIYSLDGVATWEFISGRFDEALETSATLVELKSRAYGGESPITMSARADLIDAYQISGRLREGSELAKESLDVCVRSFGEDADETLRIWNQYGLLLFQRGQFSEAEAEAREILRLARSSRGENDELTRRARSLLAASLISQGRIQEGRELYNGKRIPSDMGVELAFQGSYQPHDPRTKVLIFWESWCPFSQRTVPAMERIYQQYRGLGLDVVGITRITRSATEERVQKFIAQKGVTYPILKGDGSAWTYFDCEGTPWIAVVQDDLLVWEGYIDNPELFPEEFLRSLLEAQRRQS